MSQNIENTQYDSTVHSLSYRSAGVQANLHSFKTNIFFFLFTGVIS